METGISRIKFKKKKKEIQDNIKTQFSQINMLVTFYEVILN